MRYNYYKEIDEIISNGNKFFYKEQANMQDQDSYKPDPMQTKVNILILEKYNFTRISYNRNERYA
jgi:hypothetical protein